MTATRKKSSLTVLLTAAMLFVFGAHSVSALPFRFSFLDQESVLEETCQLLYQNGFSEDSILTFRKVVKDYYRSGNRVDRAKFPPLQAGYYQFQGFADFTNRMPHHLYKTPGSNSLPETTLMCFDVACLLLDGAGCAAPRWEANFEAKKFVTISQDGETTPAVAEKLRSGIGVLFAETGYKLLTGRPRSEAETQIGVSLRTGRRLPAFYRNIDSDLRSIFAAHVRDVKKDGFRFPGNCALGLGFIVKTSHHYIWGDHAFICIKKGGRFICLEKNGPKGPFVRVEFESEAEVGQYMSWDLLDDAADPKLRDHYGASVLISLNERLIGIYRPDIQPQTGEPDDHE